MRVFLSLRVLLLLSLSAMSLQGCSGARAYAPVKTMAVSKNFAPVADPGLSKRAYVDIASYLDGSKSSDDDGDALSYLWSIALKPVGSRAVISDPASIKPIFTPDKEGVYTIQLIVNDGKTSSATSRVTVTASVATAVGGTIKNDTTWTLADSPYVLTDNVTVEKGKRLKIEPGVTIEGENKEILVYGLFEAQGRIESSIIFNNILFKSFLPEDTSSPETSDGTVRINFAKFIQIKSDDTKERIEPDMVGNIALQNSMLTDYSLQLLADASAQSIISNNIFKNCRILLSGASGEMNMQENVILQSEIYINGSINFSTNTCVDSSLDINTYSGANGKIIIKNNSLHMKSRFVSFLGAEKVGTFDISENYWHTNDIRLIQATIKDALNDFAIKTTAIFQPILLTPDILSPDPPPYL